MKINQISNAISNYDAISNQMLEIKNTLHDMGHDSKIYVRWKAENPKDDSIITMPDPENKEHYKIPKSLLESDIVIFHHHSKSFFLEVLEKLICKKILYYHNITPPHFFRNIDNNLAQTLEKGLEQLNQLKLLCPNAVGSKFNQIELEKLKFSKVFELPYFIDKNQYTRKTSRLENNNKIYDNIIFVGRIAPNKKQDDLIKIFYYYSNLCNPNSRLFLTGSISTHNPNPYEIYLISLIKKLGLEHKVIFTGIISFEKLLSLYEIADIFLCMSEHEGFCVPLIESMLMKVPIIAYKSTAIPYTMNNTGILVDEKNHKLAAQIIWKLINDKKLYSKVINEQLKYVNDTFTNSKFKNSLNLIIREITNGKN